MGYSGAGGKLIHEKNQKQKISWHCLFNVCDGGKSIARAIGGVGPNLGQNGSSFARAHFRAKKSLDFQGPPLPMALEMDFPPSKSLQVHW